MTTVLTILDLFVTIALIGIILIQRSEGGGLGIGTSGGMGSFMTGRGTANLLTRTTAVLASLFMALSLTLALLNRGTAGAGHTVLEPPPVGRPAATAPAVPTPNTVPAAPAPNTAPLKPPPAPNNAPQVPTQ